MKKLLIILLIALISIQLFAQERVDEPLLRKVEKPLSSILSLQIILGNDYDSYNKWQIVDLQGKVILEAPIDKIESRQIDIDIKNLSTSTYILHLLGEEEMSIRFVKN